MKYIEIKNEVINILSNKKDFDDNDNLLELGLDSLQIMRLINKWRKKGIRVQFGDLIENPTFKNWWELISIEIRENTLKKSNLEKIITSDKNTSFPLTDIQYAYKIGREDDQVLGGVGCHAYLEFDGKDIDIEKLEKAWSALQYHHEMLRAQFEEDGKQKIMNKPYDEHLTIYDLRDSKDYKEQLKGIREKISHRKLNVEKGQVAGLTISLLPNSKERIHFDVDLLVADVQSLQVLFRDLVKLYNGEDLSLESKKWSFSSYLKLLNKEEIESRKDAEDYWKNRIRDIPMGPELPLMKKPSEIKTVKFKRRIINLNKEDWNIIKQKAYSLKVTPANILLAAYALVLEKWSNTNHFLINIPLFNRRTSYSGIENVIADFTNLLLLEVDMREEQNFKELLKSIQKQMYKDIKYSSYSGVQVQRDFNKIYEEKQNIAPVVFACNLGNPLITKSFEKSIGKFNYMISQTPGVWLDFQVYENDLGLMLTWDSVDELFPENMINDMFYGLEKCLKQLKELNWDEEINLLPEYQEDFIKRQKTINKIESITCLHERFIDQVEKNPTKIALIDTNESIQLTYKELEREAFKVASFIIKKDIKKEPIAISLTRGYKQVIAILGVILSGNFYVPISVKQPKERRRAIHKKTGIKYLITDELNSKFIECPENKYTYIFENMIKECSLENIPSINPKDLAYIIMTSGTTGVPKGVEITHKGAWNTIEDINKKFKVIEDDSILCLSSIDFDLSVYDLFGMLSCGGTLILIPEDKSREAEFWLEQVLKYKITIWNSVPVLLDMLLIVAERKNIKLPFRLAMLSGDWIRKDLPERLSNLTENCKFISMGGATEASIWSNYLEVKLPMPNGWKTIPYGRPLENQTYRIVDEKGNDVPFWTEGELLIGGYGVAKGYRGDEGLTNDKFIKDEYGRWYKTGDKGRFWSDGTIEFLGRKDFQVKIRGHRIELGEIENTLKNIQGIKNIVVDVFETRKNEKQLVAYLEAEKERPLFMVESQNDKIINLDEKLLSKVNLKFNRELNETNIIVCNLMIETLRSLGVFYNENINYTYSEVLNLCSVSKEQELTIKKWLKVLVKNKILIEENKSFKLCKVDYDNNFNYHIEKIDPYIETLKPYLKDLICGNINPLDIFYNEKLELSPVKLARLLSGSDEALEILLNQLEVFIEENKQEEKIKIIDFESRDINVTKAILEKIENKNVEFTYADSSSFFLNKIKEELKDYSFINYKILDLEDIKNIDVKYDYFIGINSIHRMKDLNSACKNIYKLLNSTGKLLMLELTTYSYLQDITAIILENGYKNIKDNRRDRLTGILNKVNWIDVLTENGFEKTISLPKNTSIAGRNIFISLPSINNYKLNTNYIKNSLEDKLPGYMIPEFYYILDKFPLSENGKINRKALKMINPKRLEKKGEVERPVTETEERLCIIWEELFNVKDISILDNYFSLGGDSLVATRLLTNIKSEFNIKLTIGDIFEKSTIKDQAKKIDKLLGSNYTEEEKVIDKIILNKDKENEPFPLTQVQQAYWIGRGGYYNLSKVSTHCYFELDCNNIDILKLQNAWNKLIKYHGMMRAIILSNGTQMILKDVPKYEIKYNDLKDYDKNKLKKELEEIRYKMSHQIIETDTWPLFDIRASVIDKEKTILHLSFDNLIFDGWSMFYLLSEWEKHYKDENINVPLLELSFRDYVLWLEDIKGSNKFKIDKMYWTDRVKDFSSAPELPLAKKESEVQDQRFLRKTYYLDKNIWRKLKEFAKRNYITPSVLLITAYSEVLRRWSSNLDFTLNLTQFNRESVHPQVEKVVGDFTTLILLEIKNSKENSFIERAKKVQNQLMNDLDHTLYSAIDLERDLRKREENVKGSIMPIVFTSGLGIDTWSEEKWVGKLIYNISQTPQVWLDHQVVEIDDNLGIFWDYINEIFYPEMIDEMFNCYISLLLELADNKNLFTKNSLSLISIPLSKQRVLANETEKEFEIKTLDKMFLEAEKRYPDNIAVVNNGVNITYKEIKEKSLYICSELKSINIKNEEVVGVLLNKSWKQIISVFGILFSGGAYIPLDIDNPKERLIKIIKNSGIKNILVEKDYLELNSWLEKWNCIVINGNESIEDETVISEKDPNKLAYVIYTSGSTGEPKGVMISHKGAVNTILDINLKYDVNEKDSILALSSLHFDLSVYDIFGILSEGGKVIIPNSSQVKDPEHWVQLMNKEKVTIWNSVPAFINMLLEYEKSHRYLNNYDLRLILLSGDWIPKELPEKLYSKFKKSVVVGLGGATEASIWSNYFNIPRGGVKNLTSIPYGKPLSNQKFYIFDRFMQETPNLVPGMLYISGEGLAKGYINDIKKTKEKFIFNLDKNERVYYTGDMGRYLLDGNIEFLGREDTQIKIKGHRVELGEIESVLKSFSNIKEAIGIVSKDEKIIVFVCKNKDQLSKKYKCLEEFNFEDKLEFLIEKDSLNIEAMDNYNKIINKISLATIVNVLEKIGIDKNIEKISEKEIFEKIKIREEFHKLIINWFDILLENKLIKKNGILYNFGNLDHKFDLEDLKEFNSENYKEFTQLYNDMKNNIPICIDIMRNKGKEVEALNKNEFLMLPNKLDQYNLTQKYMKNMFINLFELYLKEYKGKTNVLEIGTRINENVKDYIDLIEDKGKYIFTDISDIYVEKIKGIYKDKEFFEARKYDFREKYLYQGEFLESFNVIIAKNTLHRSFDLDTTLLNLKRMLKEGGVLFLHEYTINSSLLLNTVAFLEEGFSNIVDDRKDKGLPLISKDKWIQKLKEAGFRELKIFSYKESNVDIGEYIIIAQVENSLSYLKDSEIMNYINKKLPEYMCPYDIVEIEKIPLNNNGKTNYKKLEGLLKTSDIEELEEELIYEEATDLQKNILEIWKSVLKNNRVNKHSSFFQCGGDSLKAIQMINIIKEKYNIDIKLTWIFETPNFISFVDKIEQSMVIETKESDEGII